MPGLLDFLSGLGAALREDVASGRDAFVRNMQRASGRGILSEGETDTSARGSAGMNLAGTAMTGSMPGGVFAAPKGAVFGAGPVQTVRDPVRNAYPGIYQRPDVVAAEAATRVAPEDPLLRQLFGVTRDDLSQIALSREGNKDPNFAFKDNPRGALSAQNAMNPRNTRRLVDGLAEARKRPGLFNGMTGWYVMDPAFEHYKRIHGGNAPREYDYMNKLMAMASPGSEVLTEINRGSAANFMRAAGRWPEFMRYGGTALGGRGSDFPSELMSVTGHPYHKTSQALPMDNYLRTGTVEMGSPKVPSYIDASGVPEVGFQTKWAVPDAHFSRAVGLADTREAPKSFKQSASMAEYQTLAPWWRDKIATPSDLQAVPAQALAWGLYSPQTGVTSPIGAPKLELIAQQIGETARRFGISPEDARDRWIRSQVILGAPKQLSLLDD